MRILGMIVIMVLLAQGNAAFAATVDLNDGRTVQGDIVTQDNKSLQINVDGIAMTYYADEIKDVDGKPFAAPSSPPAPSTPPMPETSPTPAAPVVTPSPDATSEDSVNGIGPEKRALILKFIDVFGTRQALTINFELMVKQIEKEKPDEAEKIRQRVKIDEIIERLLPIYARHFTSEDLKACIAFYGSTAGQKLRDNLPLVMKESVGESVKYMEEKFPEVKRGQ